MSDADSSAWIVREGQDVLASDGKKIGEVTGSSGSALIVRHGFLFTAKDLYVPVSAIAAIDPEAVHLNIPSDVATSDEWTRLPEGATIVPNVDPEAADPLSAIPGDVATPAPGEAWQITEGMAVIGADGERIGEVEDGTEGSIAVRVGRFFSRTVTITADQIADVRGDAVHVTATKASLGHGASAGSETPLSDLQGQITNAWSGTRADLDAGVPAVDLGQPDPELPITPPSGDVPYTAPASTTEGSAPSAAVPGIAEAATAATPFAVARANAEPLTGDAGTLDAPDAPDETIDSAAIAGEVPGLDLSDAGIPAESEGGIVVAPDDAEALTTTTDRLTEANDVWALGDTEAIGESPDPDLVADAASLAATSDYPEVTETGYTDLPSDPYEGDGDRPEDAVTFAADTTVATSDESGPTAAPPVDLPGDIDIAFEEEATAPADRLEDAPGFITRDDQDAIPPIPPVPSIADAPAFTGSTLGATPSEPATPLAASGEGEAAGRESSPERPENEGLFGQLRHRIASLFDKDAAPARREPEQETPDEYPTAAAGVAGAALLAQEGASRTAEPKVDIDATVPDVEVGATLPDVPAPSASSTLSAATPTWDTGDDGIGVPDAGAETWRTSSDAPAIEREGFLDSVKERVENFLDRPDKTEDTPSGAVETAANAASLRGDAINAPIADLPDADLTTGEEPESDTGFFENVKERVDTFLDAPAANAPDRDAEATLSRGDQPSLPAVETAAADGTNASAVLSDEERASVFAEDATVVTDANEPAPGAEDVLTDDELESVYGEDAPLAVDVDPAFVAETEGAAAEFADAPLTDEEPEEVAAEAYAQELYVSDPDIDGAVRRVDADVPDAEITASEAAEDIATPLWADRPDRSPDDRLPVDSEFAPEVEEHPALDARSELAPDVEVPTTAQDDREGFFTSLRDKVEEFLDNPDEAEASDAPALDRVDADAIAREGERKATTSAATPSTTIDGATTAETIEAASTTTNEALTADDAFATDATLTADAFGAPADSTEVLASRYTVVSNDDDDFDDLSEIVAGDETIGEATGTADDDAGTAGDRLATDLFASDVEVQGASDAFEALTDREQLDALDLEVDEAAAVPLVPTQEPGEDDIPSDEGEQAESDLFAAVVDATTDSDIDAFGTVQEHPSQGEALAADGPDTDDGGEPSAAKASFSPTPDAAILAELPSDEHHDGDLRDLTGSASATGAIAPSSDAEAALTEAEEITGSPDGPGDAGDLDLTDPDLDGSLDTDNAGIAQNATSGTVAAAAGGDWGEGDVEASSAGTDASSTPSPLAGDRTNADNARTGSLAGASDAINDATSQDRTIAGNALGGQLAGAGDLATDWTTSPGDAPASQTSLAGETPLAGDTTVAENAQTGTLADAGDAVAKATAQDRTIAENARTGTLAGASDLARSWSSGEAASTAGNAQAAIEGKAPTIEGAVPLSAREAGASETDAEPEPTPAEPEDDGKRTLHGPAETEGVDWVVAGEGEDAPNGWLVKGNADSGIYHTPESPSYGQTIAEVWFPDAEAAERAGYRAPRNMPRTGEVASNVADAAGKAADAATKDDER